MNHYKSCHISSREKICHCCIHRLDGLVEGNPEIEATEFGGTNGDSGSDRMLPLMIKRRGGNAAEDARVVARIKAQST